MPGEAMSFCNRLQVSARSDSKVLVVTQFGTRLEMLLPLKHRGTLPLKLRGVSVWVGLRDNTQTSKATSSGHFSRLFGRLFLGPRNGCYP